MPSTFMDALDDQEDVDVVEADFDIPAEVLGELVEVDLVGMARSADPTVAVDQLVGREGDEPRATLLPPCPRRARPPEKSNREAAVPAVIPTLCLDAGTPR
jgi:hypothetical protein